MTTLHSHTLSDTVFCKFEGCHFESESLARHCIYTEVLSVFASVKSILKLGK